MFFLTSKAQQKEMAIDWSVAAVLPPAAGAEIQPGVAGALAGVHNDVLLVGGGANFPDAMPWLGGKKKYYNDVFVFEKGAKGNLKVLQQAMLPQAIGYAASCTTPLGVVYAGGENAEGLSNNVWLLQWHKKELVVSSLPSLPVAITNAAMAYSNNIVYLAGGETAADAVRQFLFLDLKDCAKGWQPLPQLPQPTSHAVLAVLGEGKNKNIYLLGGRSKTVSGISQLYNNVFVFDVAKGIWVERKPLPYALSAGTGIAAGKTFVLLFGGDRGETFNQTEKLIAAINAEKDPAIKEALNQQKIQLQAGHPGFSKDVLLYDTQSNEWTKLEPIPFEVAVTTTAVKWNNRVYIASGEIKAGVRTPQILFGSIHLKGAGN